MTVPADDRREYQIGVTSLEAALRQIHTDLIEAHASFALVDGLAVSARTEPRFTRDADLAVAVASDAEAEALIHELRARGYHRGRDLAYEMKQLASPYLLRRSCAS